MSGITTNESRPVSAWLLWLIGVAMGVLVFAVVGSLYPTWSVGARKMRDATIHAVHVEAVEHGCGEWVVQPDGSTVFAWRGGDG